MKNSLMLALGLVIGIGGSSAFFLTREAKMDRAIQAIVLMNNEGLVSLSYQAAQALQGETSESLRDFANYVVDSGLSSVKRSSSPGAHDDLLKAKALSIPQERRALSPSASQVMVIARQQIETMPQ